MGPLGIVIDFGIGWPHGGVEATAYLWMEQEMPDLVQEVLTEFEQVTTFKAQPTSEYMSALIDLCEFLKDKPLRPKNVRTRWLLAHINRKFRLESSPSCRCLWGGGKMRDHVQLSPEGGNSAGFRSVRQRGICPSTPGKEHNPITQQDSVRTVSTHRPRRNGRGLC